MEFEWSPSKAAENFRKHRVSFQEAMTVFGDSLSATAPDPDHSIDEDRWVTIGHSNTDRLLMVSHAESGGRTRIISARKLTPTEKRAYEEAEK